jgi:2-oxoisovalerate dehydrogenase E1 component
LYNSPSASALVPDDFEVPFGKARIRRPGKDLTIVTYGNTTHLSLQAAEKLANEGFDVEVIDLRSLIPLDKESIVNSVKKTGKVLIVHEDKVFGGFGGELASIISEEAFEFLDAPIRRVGSAFTPVGFNRILEAAILPDEKKILDAAIKLLKY